MTTDLKSKIIELPQVRDKRGNLSFIEEYNHIPFKIKRTYWIYDVPGGEAIDGHVYRNNEEFIVALSGSFEVELDNGLEKKKYQLNRSHYGLYIPRMYWSEVSNFSTNSLALIISSTEYTENDCIRSYQIFKTVCNKRLNDEK